MSFTETREPFGEFTKLNIKHDGGGNEITIIPEMGARLNHFQVSMHGESVDIIEGYSDTSALAAESGSRGSFLAPYPNCIADGKYHFNGHLYQFDVNKSDENNSVNGFVSNQSFSEVSSGEVDDCYEVVLQHTSEGVSGYPFPFVVNIIYRFGGVWLQVETEIVNSGDKKIPVGFGWYPYFRITGTVDKLQLLMSDIEKIEVDKRLIPTGEKSKYSKFNKLAYIGDSELNTGFHFLGEQKEAQLYDESHGMYLNISMSGKENHYDYLQLYTPPNRESIAITPMTCAANAFNNGQGLKTLGPGESLKAQFTIVAS